MVRHIAFFAALPLVAAPLHAQDASAPGTIVVTATHAPAALARQPYSVRVIDADVLAAGASVADVLAQVPDAYVQMTGGRSGFASLFLRGADPNFTTVLLEGVPLDSPTNSRGGAVNLAAVPPAAIDRVELIAGPASTLYGSGPLAGAINLLLAAPSERHRFTASAALGSEEEHVLSGRWQGPLTQGYGGSLTAVWDDAGTGEPQAGFRSRSVDLRLARLDGTRGSLLVHLADTRAHGFPDSSGGYDLAVIRAVEQRESDEIVVALDQPVIHFGRATLAIAGSYSSRGDRVTSPGVAPSVYSETGVPAGADDIRYRRGVVRPELSVDLGAWHATFGAQAQWEAARSSGFLDFGFPMPAQYDRRRATYSGFAELGGTVGPLEIDGGLRLDDIEGIGTRWTGRAGLRYFLDPALSLRASAGTAFKAPSFYALANPFVGNPALRPESATAMELGLDWRPGPNDHISITLFESRYRDLIDFVPSDPPRLENRARVAARGLAASVVHRFGAGLAMTLGAQHVATEDVTSGEGLLNRPRWRGSAQMDWTAARALTLTARYAYTDERDDYAVPTGVRTLEVTHRLSASAVWALSSGTRLRLDGDNLLQDRGADAIGFRPLPRRVRVTLVSSIG